MSKLLRVVIMSAVALGILAGLGLATFHYANGTSYLSHDPAVCTNCHIMQSNYDSWQKSSHHTVAGCADCHLPAHGIQKYVAKAMHGWNHSKGFTLLDFPEPIRVSEATLHDLQANCLRCHADLVHAQSGGRDGAPSCRHCHSDVGHGPRTGLGGPLNPKELEVGTP